MENLSRESSAGRTAAGRSHDAQYGFVRGFLRCPTAHSGREIDIDNIDESDGTRLIRCKTTRYLSHEQRAQIRFIYEKYQYGRAVESYIDDFVCHVFFPRELRLLFSHTGFAVEETLGDYRARALKADSPVMIMIGRRST